MKKLNFLINPSNPKQCKGSILTKNLTATEQCVSVNICQHSLIVVSCPVLVHDTLKHIMVNLSSLALMYI